MRLNRHFSSVFTRENIEVILWSDLKWPTMLNFTVTEPGVIILLSKLDMTKAVSPDKISPRVLKEAHLETVPVVTFFCN